MRVRPAFRTITDILTESKGRELQGAQLARPPVSAWVAAACGFRTYHQLARSRQMRQSPPGFNRPRC